jgi:hypothetical protein
VRAIDHAHVIVRLGPVLHDRVSSTRIAPVGPAVFLDIAPAPDRHPQSARLVYDGTGEDTSSSEK